MSPSLYVHYLSKHDAINKAILPILIEHSHYPTNCNHVPILPRSNNTVYMISHEMECMTVSTFGYLKVYKPFFPPKNREISKISLCFLAMDDNKLCDSFNKK